MAAPGGTVAPILRPWLFELWKQLDEIFLVKDRAEFLQLLFLDFRSRYVARTNGEMFLALADRLKDIF